MGSESESERKKKLNEEFKKIDNNFEKFRNDLEYTRKLEFFLWTDPLLKYEYDKLGYESDVKKMSNEEYHRRLYELVKEAEARRIEFLADLGKQKEKKDPAKSFEEYKKFCKEKDAELEKKRGEWKKFRDKQLENDPDFIKMKKVFGGK